NVAQLARRKPPFGIAQVGKSFRNEITPGNFLFRVLEFEHMEMEFFVPPADATEWFEYWLERRLAWHRSLGLRDENLRVREHEEVVGDRERVVLRLHPQVAPVKAAILPLVPRDEGMATRARALYEELRLHHVVEHDEGGQIGRRYRRQDEIGTPWAFTVDEQTLEDDTVTVRDRDSLAQERLPIAGVLGWLEDALEQPWSSPKT